MRRAVLALLAVAASFAGGGAPAASAAVSASSSSNWSGYVSTRTKGFRKVSATWTVPALSCSSGATYSAAWVGLGGSSSSSQALEQAGTEADCSSSGGATYSAWYELVPDVGHDLDMQVRAGDRISTSVAVSGKQVTVRMTNKTTGRAITKKLTAATVDTTSAEWIVEAPSLCSGTSLTDAQCDQTSLANFGQTRFANARATSRLGHEGTIVDPAWSTTALSLIPAASGGWGGPGRFVRESVSGAATPGTLNATGDSFAVAWVDGSVTASTSVARTRASVASAG